MVKVYYKINKRERDTERDKKEENSRNVTSGLKPDFHSSNSFTQSRKEDIALVGIKVMERITSFSINTISSFSDHVNKIGEWKSAL